MLRGVPDNLVFLLPCGRRKKPYRTYACDMYEGRDSFIFFRFCRRIVPANRIYYLSAEYGLINSMDMIMPYNKVLNNCTKEEFLSWQLRTSISIRNKLNKHQVCFFTYGYYLPYFSYPSWAPFLRAGVLSRPYVAKEFHQISVKYDSPEKYSLDNLFGPLGQESDDGYISRIGKIIKDPSSARQLLLQIKEKTNG